MTTMASIAAVVLMTAGVLAQAKPNFAGKWTMDAPAAGAAAPGAPAGGPGGGGGRGGGRGGLGMEITIVQDATTLTINGMQGGAPTKMVYKLDGTESKNMAMGRGGEQTEQVAKAAWMGDKLVVTTTLATGVQKRTLSMEGGKLAVETEQPGRDGGPGTPTKSTYTKG
ncbi:MAG: hypothetical protein ABI051_08195 [Vicinamibacterales bacterium]